jgi:hypothetical protein
MPLCGGLRRRRLPGAVGYRTTVPVGCEDPGQFAALTARQDEVTPRAGPLRAVAVWPQVGLADIRISQRRLDEAAWLTTQALVGFERHGAPYDVAAAQLTLARIASQGGRCAEAVDRADRARAAIEAGGYRVLYQLFPDQAVPPAARIPAGFLPYPQGVRPRPQRGEVTNGFSILSWRLLLQITVTPR